MEQMQLSEQVGYQTQFKLQQMELTQFGLRLLTHQLEWLLSQNSLEQMGKEFMLEMQINYKLLLVDHIPS